jgi:hypothetical protein
MADWHQLAAMRRRGERPIGGVWIAQDGRRRRLLAGRDLFALDVPSIEQCYLAAGLDVFLLAVREQATIDVALAIAAATPRYFVTAWQGDLWREVIACTI